MLPQTSFRYTSQDCNKFGRMYHGRRGYAPHLDLPLPKVIENSLATPSGNQEIRRVEAIMLECTAAVPFTAFRTGLREIQLQNLMHSNCIDSISSVKCLVSRLCRGSMRDNRQSPMGSLRNYRKIRKKPFRLA